MTTESYTDIIEREYNLCWPLTCIYCGSKEVWFSQYQVDARCQCCGKWQLKEEENGHQKNTKKS